MSKKKGTRAERAVVNALDRDGWTVVRTPASGGATQRDLPDLVAGTMTDAFEEAYTVPDGSALAHDTSWSLRIAAEVKYRSSGSRLNCSGEEVSALRRFAERFAAYPVIITRWKGDTTAFVVSAHDLDETDGGNYSISASQSEQLAQFAISETTL